MGKIDIKVIKTKHWVKLNHDLLYSSLKVIKPNTLIFISKILAF